MARMVHRRASHVLCAFLAVAACPAPGQAPSIARLVAHPPKVVLDGLHDRARVLVTGVTAEGFHRDLTRSAAFRLTSPIVAQDSSGLLRPLKAGSATLSLTAAGHSISVPVVVKSTAAKPVSFVRDVMPILSKSGCNIGTCHGSVKGKNGFKLSLRGFDPEFDHRVLVTELAGRRYNRARPEESLILLKPTQTVAHQGGLAFDEKSRPYGILKRWLSAGAPSDAAKAGRASSIEVLPTSPRMRLQGERLQLLVLARYPDGSRRDVTEDAVYTSTMPETMTVSESGAVSAVRRGEASVLVRYEGNYSANSITVIGDRTGYRWIPQPQLSYVDRLVDAKLKRVFSVPSGLCTDEEFARRVHLDLTGVPPTPDELRAFLADRRSSRAKRTALIGSLIGSDDFVENWTNKWADLLQVNRKYLGERGAWKFRGWIRRQLAGNVPYDEMVRDLMTATGPSFEDPAASYFRIARDPNTATENVTQLFLGIRFSCNKCHDHPFERWTQKQYYQFAAHFARVSQKPVDSASDESVYERPSGEVIFPRTNQPVAASFPYRFGSKPEGGRTPRETLANWLTSEANPFFARSIVNRVWSYLLGKGIIDPVDDIRGSNPPSNPELLDALTSDFVKGGFDLRKLMRTICESRVYQASIRPNRWNEDDQTNFSHAVPRRLAAEQLVDSLARATGAIQRYPGVPAGFRAVQLPDPSVAAGGLMDLFGRPPRESPCECERTSNISLGQTLNLINNPLIHDSIQSADGRIAALAARSATPKEMLDEVFLATICRFPSQAETKRLLPLFRPSTHAIKEKQALMPVPGIEKVTEVVAEGILRKEAAQDLMWALLNSPAFLFNR